jgi:hypothetical protein
MAVELNNSADEHAQSLIKEGHSVDDERDDWSEHQPSAEEENKLIDEHGSGEYACMIEEAS